VIVGVQIVLWVVGGLVMSAFPIELVRGETASAPPDTTPIGAAELKVSLPEVLAATGPVESLRTSRIAGRLYLEVARTGQPPMLVDAADGSVLEGVPAGLARQVAEADFTGTGEVKSVTLQADRSSEYRGTLPVWRVEFDDARDTRLFVSPQTGRLVARRNDVWRLYDFFWMLHIMDYKERVDFNSPLLIIASAVALIVSLSGFWLLFYRVRLRDWRALRRG
jgi:hypothetical protein